VPRRGQGLHLSRTMLSDQWSPYVGRFACDWHRLPGGFLPGNHRPGQEHSRIIATGGNATSQRAGGRQNTHFSCARAYQRPRALRRSGAAGQDVVNQDHPLGWGCADTERASQGAPALTARPSGLRSRFDHSLEQRPDAPPGQLAEGSSQRFRLVVATRSPPSPSKRDPRQEYGLPQQHRSRRRAGHRQEHPRGEALGDRTEPSELQLHEGRSGRAFVEEGRPRPGDGPGRTVRAALEPGFEWPAAPDATRRTEEARSRPARLTERPGASATAGAPAREQDVENGPEHSPNGTSTI
jgi:hypothetical protein